MATFEDLIKEVVGGLFTRIYIFINMKEYKEISWSCSCFHIYYEEPDYMFYQRRKQ